MTAVRRICFFTLATTIFACGGGGGPSSGSGAFTILSNPPGGSQTGYIYGVSNTGVAVGEGAVSVPGYAGLAPVVWQGGVSSAANPIIPTYRGGVFSSISPNGNWATGQAFSTNQSHSFVFRYHVPTQTFTVDSGPATGYDYQDYAYRTFDDSSSVGELTHWIGQTGTLYRFNFNAVAVMTLTSGEYFDGLFLNNLPGGGAPELNSFSNNGNFVVGSENLPLGPGIVGTAVIWNVSTGVGQSLGYLATNGSAQSQGYFVSNDGSVAVVRAADNSNVQQYCVWDAIHGLRTGIELMHAHGFANAYSWCAIDAISPDGRYIAGNLGTGENVRDVAFVYLLP